MRAEPELDWDAMESVPLVGTGPDAESGEDYWVDLRQGIPAAAPPRPKKPINSRLKRKLKEEVVSPYTQNWILWVSAIIAILAIAFYAVGGFDTIPIIQVPDL